MDNKKGTPKTLLEAVINGLQEAKIEHTHAVLTNPKNAKMVKAHVKDFLAHKFNVAILNSTAPEIEKMLFKLFEEVTNEA